MIRESTLFLSFHVALGTFIAIALLLIFSCATTDPEPHPEPEQMPQGRQICKAMCVSVNREYVEYRYDGKCICTSAQ